MSDAKKTTSPSAGSGETPACNTTTGCCAICLAQVKFTVSANQRYGFDDFDTPNNFTDDHINIKKSDHTFVKVDITGASGSDINFECDDTSICTPASPPASASFDLRLDAGNKNKDGTTLRAKCKCSAATPLASIEVHVYKEKIVNVVAAKIHDSQSAGSTLRFATADYAAHTSVANTKLKEAVVKFNITNFDPANASTDVRFDLDSNNALSFDIANGGGSELTAIKRAMTGTGSRIRVAVIKNLKSFFYLSSAAAIGDTTITVTASKVFSTTRAMPLGTGANAEMVTVASSSGSTFTLSAPLTKAHTAGTSFEFPAGGWSSDPIIIQEGSSSLDVVKWTILHEVGHRALQLADIDDQKNFMHFQQSWTDYRLRYCPRQKVYEPKGSENQWETIPR